MRSKHITFHVSSEKCSCSCCCEPQPRPQDETPTDGGHDSVYRIYEIAERAPAPQGSTPEQITPPEVNPLLTGGTGSVFQIGNFAALPSAEDSRFASPGTEFSSTTETSLLAEYLAVVPEIEPIDDSDEVKKLFDKLVSKTGGDTEGTGLLELLRKFLRKLRWDTLPPPEQPLGPKIPLEVLAKDDSVTITIVCGDYPTEDDAFTTEENGNVIIHINKKKGKFFSKSEEEQAAIIWHELLHGFFFRIHRNPDDRLTRYLRDKRRPLTDLTNEELSLARDEHLIHARVYYDTFKTLCEIICDADKSRREQLCAELRSDVDQAAKEIRDAADAMTEKANRERAGGTDSSSQQADKDQKEAERLNSLSFDIAAFRCKCCDD